MMMTNVIKYFDEPKVEFGFSQISDDCRDGLTLFGPFKKGSGDVRIGVIGTKNGLIAYNNFSSNVNKPVFTKTSGRPFFPGFKTIFGINWPINPVVTLELTELEIKTLLDLSNLYERTYQLVTLYLSRIKDYLETEESPVALWYIVIPHELWLNCRPKSASGRATYSKQQVETYNSGQTFLFDEDNENIDKYSKMYEADSDFHDQMKARILAEKIQTPVQIMLENTLLFNGKDGKPYSDDMKAHLLWTQCTSTYYKHGYLPWKLYDIRKGVCYIGLVFKTLQDYQLRNGYACCAAQMFLDTGDGMVFRGNIGPWLSRDEKTYHLDEQSAEDLIKTAIDAYKKNTGDYPKELFIHGRTKFSDEEWEGFAKAVSLCNNVNLVGITIHEIDGFRLYKDTYGQKCKYGILRGLALKVDKQSGYLWTKGYIPRTETSNHMEVARPMKLRALKGAVSEDCCLIN
jgi:hypothetical protein